MRVLVSTPYSQALYYWEHFLFVYSALSFNDIQLNKMKYTALLSQHQLPIKKKRNINNGWHTQWIMDPHTERFWKQIKVFANHLWGPEIYKNGKYIHEETASFTVMESGGMMGYIAESFSTWKSWKQIQAWMRRHANSQFSSGSRVAKW